MADHRIRLSDDDLSLICAALRSRAAMTTGVRQHRVERLIARLAEGGTGNPRWRIDPAGQLREDSPEFELDESD